MTGRINTPSLHITLKYHRSVLIYGIIWMYTFPSGNILTFVRSWNKVPQYTSLCVRNAFNSLAFGWQHSMAYYCTNTRTLKVLMTHQLMYRDTLWHNYTNVRTFLYGKVFTRRTPYGNTVGYYWRTICIDGGFILSVIFLLLIYLKYY